MGLNVAFPLNLRRMFVFSVSAARGSNLCIAPAVRRMVSLSWSVLAITTSMRKSRVIVSLVSSLLFCGVSRMVRLMYYLAHKACMATSLHFLARTLSFLIGSLKAKPCLSRCLSRRGSASAMTLVYGYSRLMMFHVKHLIPVLSRKSTLRLWR